MIVDGDPVYSNGDILTLSTQVDGVVLVVRSEETCWEVAPGRRTTAGPGRGEADRQRVQRAQVLHAQMGLRPSLTGTRKVCT